MDTRVQDFIAHNRLCVVAIELEDGTPHASTLHFAHTFDPFLFLVLTEKDCRKCEKLLKEGSAKASAVVGVSEELKITCQLDGIVNVVDGGKELDETKNTYFKKFPESRKYDGPNSIYLKFIPSWWRYTDYTTEPETIIASEGEI